MDIRDMEQAKAFTYHFVESRKLTSLEEKAMADLRRICDIAITLYQQRHSAQKE